MLSKADVWNPVQQRTTLMQWKISLPGQELGKLGLKSLWNPKGSQMKCHKCRSTSHLANTCAKKTKINEVQLIEEVDCSEEKKGSDHDSEISQDTPVEDYPIVNITAFFEVT
ncbi:hypothetical protein O181_046760 [Austropuccinia psidii MF-1]|uniref:CCHC-type domain-containing protein n=1 Tax=Austropuccinia psidii MF-1 TaxID=1389203 RepID=A0A9Q3DP35_9BASI|nr:hypothetical protein [Austropuccinia psidii MF-1]